MNVVLVNPPIRLPYAFAHYPMFSTLGLLANAAWLREKGHEVRVVDAFTLRPDLTIRPDGEGFRHVGAEVAEVLHGVAATVATLEGPTALVVSVTMFSEMNRPAENLVPATTTALRERFPDAPIGLADLHICGMNYFPYDPEKVLRELPAADWILVGEGEPTLPTLLERLAAGATLEGLPRLARRTPDGVVYDPTEATPLPDLDALPPPAFDLVDMDHYFSAQADAIRGELVHEYHLVERQIPLMTSRGCPYRCNFCTNQVLGLPWRAHSVEYLARLLRDLRDRYRVDRFLFLDDNINIQAPRFRGLVEWLAEERIPWDAVNGYRADRLDRETVRAIKAAGNTKITVSAESGDPDLLKKVIHKGLKLSAIIDLAKICEEERIPLQIHYILGVPGETKAQINKTLEFCTLLFERHGAWPLLQHAIPFPGTEVFRECEEKGYFIADPHTIPGEVLEVESIIRTPEFEPGEVIRMKTNAQHLHAAMQGLVYLEVTGRCDSACLACHCAPQHGDEPTRERLRTALDRARFLGGRELFLSGGEPTLRDDLADVVAEARGMGFERVTLVTNAHGLVDKARTARLVAAGVDRLALDLFGPSAEVHDAVAGRPGAHLRTLQGVAVAVQRGVRDLEANIPIVRANLEALPDTVRFARGLGVKGVHLQLPGPDTRAFAKGQVPSWAEAWPWLSKAVAAGGKRGFVSIQGAPLCLLPAYPGLLTPLPPWALQRARAGRVKHTVCMGCTEYMLCGGFFRPDFEPVYGAMAAAREVGVLPPESGPEEGTP